MKEWILQQWKPARDGEMLLVLDVHKAQKTECILSLFKKTCKTDLVYVPPGDMYIATSKLLLLYFV